MNRQRFHLLLMSLLFVAPVASADDEEPTKPAANTPAELLAGHSAHGEAFNEGPRQQAYLMEGTGKVDFPITTTDPLAQKFFNQGIGQLHGFWYFEAERSFRQVAALDTNCAMAYWGAAMANLNNEKRAKEFIKKAAALKKNTDRREAMWIDALVDYYKDRKEEKKAEKKEDGKYERKEEKTPEKQRRRDLVRNLENIVHEFPGDLEAKAFLVLQIWNNGGELPISSAQAVDALADQVLAVEPMHPIHHYRIHLWNSEKDQRALNSAARCGQSAPAIAHMWHMPGHTFTKLL